MTTFQSHWEQACAESLARSRARRQEREQGPHPFPRRGHVIATGLAAAVFILIAWALVTGAWAIT